MSQLEIKVGGIVTLDPDLNRGYTHELEQDSKDRKTMMVVPRLS
jgi:hypothetical protein